ncbi:MAG: hypothetical protein Kow00121_35680 [Elainellaceae cyanobacterium]
MSTIPIRFSQFNASLNRSEAGQLVTDLSTPDNAQVQAVAEIIQRNNPDVLLINEFDYVADDPLEPVRLFQENYLSVSQNGADPIEYPYVYIAPSNTGIASGFDLNNDGQVVATPGELGYGDDALGFGNFPGQFGMLLLSKYPIDSDNVRAFQNFLWKDMPGALLPDDPTTPQPDDWYSPEELEVFRLSSKSHWDVPIQVNGEVVHVLVSHPTPPVFDGEEDRNGRRNHDEIRFWADYITPGAGDYIYDDNGNEGGLAEGAKFVIMGDQNADPNDGDSFEFAIRQLLDNPLINPSVTPSSKGGPDASSRQGGINDEHISDPAFDTADFADTTPGNLRADYVLPSENLEITDAQVFWVPDEDPLFRLIGDFNPKLPGGYPASDHRLVRVDVNVPSETETEELSRSTVTEVELLGNVTFPTGFTVEETEVGGLSGITYDAEQGIYYAISDDRSQTNPVRYYTVAIDLSDGTLDDSDITFEAVTTLTDRSGTPYPEASVDFEGIALHAGALYISSEGDANNLVDPAVNLYTLDGQETDSLPVPDKFLPTEDQSSGIRNNLAFESLTITPNGRYLYTATEAALYQDGEISTLEDGSTVRLLQYDLTTGEPVQEFVYLVEPIPQSPVPADGFADNGLVDLLAIDNSGTFLALERSFAEGVGNTIKLFEVSTQGALDISGEDGLLSEEGASLEVDPSVRKRELLDFAGLGFTPDNIEGLTFGPTLPDGRQSLIVVSDNNFNSAQQTQFVALALDLETIPAVQPTVETPPTFDMDEPPSGPPLSSADDPAIYVNPIDASRSIVITALKNGGLQVHDLNGNLLQTIAPDDPEDLRYNNVDVLYGFQLGEETVDLAIASDRANDTIAIYQIDPSTRQLTNITAADVPETLFGIDDGEQTAYGLANYISPVTGKAYSFVTQSDGNQIAQLELIDNGAGQVTAEIVRTFSVPLPADEEREPLTEGVVADYELGYVYIGQEQVGIWKFSAEPDGSNTGVLIDPVKPDGEALEADVEGLTLYYGADGTGYLIASSQGDSTFAVYSREGNNDYLGSFIVTDSNGIDSTDGSDGLDVVNVPLGDQFPQGLLVVHDQQNQPILTIEDDGELTNVSGNFKSVPWENVAHAFSDPLDIDPTSYDPRNPQPNSLLAIGSGDTTQTSTVLWARSSSTGRVRFEFSLFPDFKYIFGYSSKTITDPSQPVKVRFGGLRPNQPYYYRVTDATGSVETGQFKTAATPGTYTGLRFGVTGDWQQAPPYPSLSNADAQDLEFFLKLGDTIYADTETPALEGITQARSLSDFRTKQAEITSTRFGLNTVRDLYASTSILATIDDHEVVDNFAGGAAPGESPDAPDIGSDDELLFTDPVTYVNDTRAYEEALQAFQEYHPIRNEFYGKTGDDRTAGERKLYRYNTYGSDAAMFVLDTRSFRDDQLDPVDLNDPVPFLVETFTPDRTLLGQAQLDTLKQDLLDAQAQGITWKFVAVPEPIQNFGVVNAEDRFEGYAAERSELLKFIDDNQIDNVVFLAGDFHGTIVNNLTYQEGPGQPIVPTNAFEIVTGPAAFFEGLFGRAVADISTASGLITPEQRAFYDALPVAPDADDLPNDKDDFIRQLLVAQTDLLGYDPVGLNNNLSEADELIDATLLQGDYVSVHTYGWTQFDIDQDTQKLTVTTYGIPDYSEADLLANPASITRLEPTIVSQFEVMPTLADSALTGAFSV